MKLIMVASLFHLTYSSPIFFIFMLTEIVLVDSVPVFSLSSTPPMNGTFCPGRVTLTCRGIEIPSLTWTINGSDLASYSNYDPMQPLPLTLSLANPTSGVQVQVESVNPYPNNPFFYNITSTLSGDVSVLRGSTIDCRRLPLRSNTIVIRGLPVPPYTNCSDLSGGRICLGWSPDFTSLHTVELYHVVVSPTPSSCLSDQLVRPSENYTCSGLVSGTCYTFTISAINCGNQQEGGRSNFRASVAHKQKRSPITSITAIYGEDSTLSEIEVEWNNTLVEDIMNDPCSDDASINYTAVIITEDSSGERLDVPVEISNCNAAMLCSMSFLLLSQQVNFYNIRFNIITNDTQVLQSFSYQHTLSGFSYQALNYSISFITVTSDMIIYAFCTSPFGSSENRDCIIQFSLNPQYANLSSPIRVPLATHFLITNASVSSMDTFYHQASITNSSLKIIVRSSYVHTTVKTDGNNTGNNITVSTSNTPFMTITSEIPNFGDFVTLKSYELGLLVAVPLLGLTGIFLIIILVLLYKVGRYKKYILENQLSLQNELDQDTPQITQTEKCITDSDSVMYEEINQRRPTRNVEDFKLTSNYAYHVSKSSN